MIFEFIRKLFGPRPKPIDGCEHDWMFKDWVPLIKEKRGPFDPRSDKDRTEHYLQHVCCLCGKEKLVDPFED